MIGIEVLAALDRLVGEQWRCRDACAASGNAELKAYHQGRADSYRSAIHILREEKE